MAGMVGPSRSVQTKCLKPKVTVSETFFGGYQVFFFSEPQKYSGQGGFDILYDFSGHKLDLEGKIQICLRYGFSRPV